MKLKFHILIPFFNCEIYLKKCIESVLAQNYNNYTCYLFDDGSSDNSSKIYQKYKKQHPNIFLCHYNKDNKGPAYSKYKGMEIIKKNCSPNDIFLIIDGDDYLKNNEALNIINEKYLNTKCWMTYGSCSGKWCEQASEPPKNNFRKEKWRYSHPRSFKCELIYHFKEQDFKINNIWLVKGTDRPLIFNCLELSGRDKIQYIEEPIYFYRTYGKNIIKVLDPKTIKKHKEYSNNQTPKKQIEEPIHIVMCSWKRFGNIQKIIDSLDDQTISDRIHLHIINNNIDLKNSFNEIYSKKIQLTIEHKIENGFGFERFLYTKKLIKESFLDYVIFIDDDQSFNSTFIENLYNKKEPKTMSCWYGKVFDKSKIQYWVRHNFKFNSKFFDYGGTGTSIIDANIFNEDSELWNTKDITNFQFKKMEDIWLSYVLSQYNWQIKNSFLQPNRHEDEITQNCSLWKNLKNEKQQFLEFLIINKNWNLIHK